MSDLVADILSTELDEEGVVRAQLGDVDSGVGLENDVALYGTDGFVSRPNDPDENGAAQASYAEDGNGLRATGTRDNRNASKAGALAPGDRAIVSNCEARFLLKKEQDAISIYTKSADDKPMLFEVSGSKGLVTLLAVGDAGNALIQMKPGRIMLGIDGGGSIVIDKKGVHIFGSHFGCNTGSGNLGTIVGVPPVAPANSVAYALGGLTASSKWTVAP